LLCYVTSHPGQISLAIRPWVGAITTGNGITATTEQENGEFCTAVGTVTRLLVY